MCNSTKIQFSEFNDDVFLDKLSRLNYNIHIHKPQGRKSPMIIVSQRAV
nr:MAG TPA: hypothetical protein [Caudoviricetes sp.]